MSAASSSKRRAKPAPRRTRRGLLTYLLIGVLLFVPLFVAASAAGWVPTPVINGVAGLFIGRQNGAVPWNGRTPVNVLIMGLQLGGASTNPLTDSMMVVSYDPSTRGVSMLSIPRDLWVEIPGHGQGRINEAFQDGGAREAILTVQQNLGIPVNYYALVSYTAFERLIDDVGGVTVDVPLDLDDPTFPAADEIHYEPFQISKGVHHLNGHDALRYARSRHSDPQGDIGRAARQQQILVALKDQLLKPANLLKLGVILRDVRSTIKTDFPLDQAAGLGFQVLRSDLSQAKRAILGYENGAVENMVTGYGAQVLAPNRQVVGEIVTSLFGSSRGYLRTGATVQVENGNGYQGAATHFSQVLAGMGAELLEPADADRQDYPTARVIARTRDRGKLQEAELIASMLGVQVERGNGEGSAEIVVILGRNYAPYVPFTSADWAEAIKP